VLPLTHRKQQSNRINLIKMKNIITLLIGDFTKEDIVPLIIQVTYLALALSIITICEKV